VRIATKTTRSSEEAFSGLSQAANIATFSAIAIGGIFALLIFYLSQRTKSVEAAVEDATATLRDKPTYVRALTEITEGELDDSWTNGELSELVARWIFGDEESPSAEGRPPMIPYRRSRTLVACGRLIGPEDFVRLFIATGKEHALLEETELWDEDGLTLIYNLKRPED
jgi:hypothetical protein